MSMIAENWGLSSEAIAILEREPEIVSDLQAVRTLPPLPPGYTPRVVEILYDDLVFIRLEGGYLTYLRPCRKDYQPPFMEVRFDSQTALFQIGGETVVNRLSAMAKLDQILGIAGVHHEGN